MATKQLLPASTFLEHPPTAALFRDLYTRVLLTAGAANHWILGVTSAIDGEGKTTIAAGLAAALAHDGALMDSQRQPGAILLIECNQHAGALGAIFDVPEAPGLVQYLQRESPLEPAIKETEIARLSVLPAGAVVPNFPILIRKTVMGELIQSLRGYFDLIIVDLPSVLTSTDTQVLAGLTDYLLLVTRARVTPTKLVTQALGELEREKVLGVVLNDRRPDLPGWLERRL